MKIRMIQTLAVALAMASTASVGQAAPTGDELGSTGDPELRVVNNHEYRVQIVLVDKSGRHHTLGHVAPNKAVSYDVEEFTDYGLPVQVKVVVDEPVWSAGATDKAVRSGALYISENTEVRVWVESDLTQTEVEVYRW
jgi:hypothetical protein